MKPFSPTGLAARIRAALRKQAVPGEPYFFGDLAVDYGQRRAIVAGVSVELTDIEYRVLAEPSARRTLLGQGVPTCELFAGRLHYE